MKALLNAAADSHGWTYITGVCSEIPCSVYCLAFCGNQSFEFYRNSTDWLPHDAGFGCGESQIANSFILSFFCLLVLYFYIAPLRVFFEYVSCKLINDINFNRSFNWYIGIFLTSFYIYCFYCTFNCSFVFLDLFR